MITEQEYSALADAPMTQERYEALCAQYGIEVTDKIAVYANGDYDYPTYGQIPQYRIYQLRAHARYQERLAAQTTQDREAQRQREIEALRQHERAILEEEEHDSGY
jgi:hypothetical protein